MSVKHCPGSGGRSLNRHSVMAHCPKCHQAVRVRSSGTLTNHNVLVERGFNGLEEQ